MCFAHVPSIIEGLATQSWARGQQHGSWVEIQPLRPLPSGWFNQDLQSNKIARWFTYMFNIRELLLWGISQGILVVSGRAKFKYACLTKLFLSDHAVSLWVFKFPPGWEPEPPVCSRLMAQVGNISVNWHYSSSCTFNNRCDSVAT